MEPPCTRILVCGSLIKGNLQKKSSRVYHDLDDYHLTNNLAEDSKNNFSLHAARIIRGGLEEKFNGDYKMLQKIEENEQNHLLQQDLMFQEKDDAENKECSGGRLRPISVSRDWGGR